MIIHKKLVLDEKGNPTEVIIPYREFLELEEMLGLDFEEEVREHLRKVREKRERGERGDYVELSEI